MENYVLHYADWVFTGRVVDNKEPIATCDLCEKHGLRYEFEIAYMGSEPLPQPASEDEPSMPRIMWVGSVCIRKFGVTVQDENGRKLQRGEIPAFLRAVVRRKKHEAVLDTLRELYRRDKPNQEKIAEIGKTFKSEKTLPPHHAVFLLNRLAAYGLSLPPGYLKITLKKQVHKAMVLNLTPPARRRLMAALSVPQQRTIRGWLEVDA